MYIYVYIFFNYTVYIYIYPHHIISIYIYIHIHIIHHELIPESRPFLAAKLTVVCPAQGVAEAGREDAPSRGAPAG